MADQNITALPVSTTPETSDQLLLVGATEEKLIDYDKLADAILNKLTSKKFSLDQGTMPLISALNQLNSKAVQTYDIGSYYNDYTFVKFLQEKQGTGITILSGYSGYLFSDLPTDLSDAVNIITYKGNNQETGIYSQGFISDSLGHRYTFVADASFSNVTFNKF